ncbi:reverse transcriptase domain-containing protein [Tanacetum coccineum]
MTTVNHWMSVEEIEQVVPQNCKKVGHITRNYRTPAAARNQRTLICYECGSLGHYKSNCLIVKFQNRVDMYWKGKALTLGDGGTMGRGVAEEGEEGGKKERREKEEEGEIGGDKRGKGKEGTGGGEGGYGGRKRIH